MLLLIKYEYSYLILGNHKATASSEGSKKYLEALEKENEKKRYGIMAKLCETEKQYVHDLQYAFHVYSGHKKVLHFSDIFRTVAESRRRRTFVKIWTSS